MGGVYIVSVTHALTMMMMMMMPLLVLEVTYRGIMLFGDR